MKKSPVSEYGYINAKLRARLSRILTEEFRRAMIDAAGMEEAVQVLGNHGYESATGAWNKTGDIQNVEFELFKNHIANYRMVIKNTDGEVKDFTSVLSIKPEIENIKTALRLWYGSRIKKRPIGYRSSYLYKDKIYENIEWSGLINAVGYDDVSNVFQNTVYREIFKKHSIIDSHDSIFDIEISLDKLYYSFLIENSKRLSQEDRRVINEILSTEIDLQNISWLIRYRHFYKMEFSELKKIIIPGGHGLELETLGKQDEDTAQAISPFDLLKKDYPELSAVNISDKHNFSGQAVMFEQLLDEARKRKFTSILSGYPFTIGIILVYFFMSGRELNFIASVLNGKNYRFTSKRIEELTK